MRTPVSPPNDLLEEAARLTLELGVTRSRLFADAAADYIRRHRASSITFQLKAVYETEPSALDPALGETGTRLLRGSHW
jgi:metal-responsive CopG/Arc/MetJ family transcriptional regulator